MTDDRTNLPAVPVCAECGHQNEEGAHLCSGCGATLPPPPAAADESTDNGDRRPWYRQPAGIVAVVLGVLLVGAVAWAVLASTDDESPGPSATTTVTTPATTAETAPATTAGGGGGGPAPTTAPPATPAPPVTSAALAAPVLTAVTPTCDTGADPQAPCTITVTWQHAGGAEGFIVAATVQNGPVAGNAWTDDVGPDARSSTIGPLATGLEECVTVTAHRGSEQVASAEQCVSTGIG